MIRLDDDYCWASNSKKVTDSEAKGLLDGFLCCGDNVIRLMC